MTLEVNFVTGKVNVSSPGAIKKNANSAKLIFDSKTNSTENYDSLPEGYKIDSQKTNATNSQKSRATKVSPEDLKTLDPDNTGVFHLNEDGFNLPLPIYGGGEIWDILEKYNGQKITPDLIDKLANVQLDYEKKHPDEMRWTEGSAPAPSMMIDLGRYAEYLKPETIDKLLNMDNGKSSLISVNLLSDWDGNTNQEAVNNMKNLYDRMNNAQKQKYYETILTKEANTNYHLTTNNEQSYGKNLANIIFEEKVSPNTYKQLKSFVADMNTPGNQINNTKTESKNLIDTLYERGQITKAQAQELYATAHIKK